MNNRLLEETTRLIQQAKGSILILTGAGISAESGIPTFRGRGGLWEKYDPEKYASLSGLVLEFKKNPLKAASYIFDFYSVLLKAKPNPAHLALAEMEKRGFLNGVITQNIDNLHRDAGSKKVWEVHGNAFRMKCENCGAKKEMAKGNLSKIINRIAAAKTKVGVLRMVAKIFTKCECGGRFRTDVVLFGEMLAQDVLEEVYLSLENCGLMLAVGTSAAVYPAAGIPVLAKERGAKIIEINKERSALTNLCDYSIFEEAGKALPEIIAGLT